MSATETSSETGCLILTSFMALGTAEHMDLNKGFSDPSNKLLLYYSSRDRFFHDWLQFPSRVGTSRQGTFSFNSMTLRCPCSASSALLDDSRNSCCSSATRTPNAPHKLGHLLFKYWIEVAQIIGSQVLIRLPGGFRYRGLELAQSRRKLVSFAPALLELSLGLLGLLSLQ